MSRHDQALLFGMLSLMFVSFALGRLSVRCNCEQEDDDGAQ